MSEILEHKLDQVEIKQTRSKIKPIRFRDEAINKVRKENYVFGNRGNLFIPINHFINIEIYFPLT